MKFLLPKNELKVGIGQMNSNEDVSANVAYIIKTVKAFAKQKVDLACFPENALFLRTDKSQKMSVSFDLKEDFWRELENLAREFKTHIFIGSIPFRDEKSTEKSAEKFSNSTVHIAPEGKAQVVYNKIHLFDVDVEGAPPSRESDDFVHGGQPKIIEINGWRIGLSICYDLRFSELYNYYAKENVHLLLVPSAFLVPTGQAHWHVLLRARAIENQAFVVAAAQSGEHKSSRGPSRYTFGHSLVVDPWGEILMDLEKPGEAAETVKLDPARLEKVRKQIPMKNHRRL